MCVFCRLFGLLMLLSVFLVSCKGEKYDISNAVLVSSSEKENLFVDYDIRNTEISYDKEGLYSGKFKRLATVKMANISSNFIVAPDGERVFYVTKRGEFKILTIKGELDSRSGAKFDTASISLPSIVRDKEKNYSSVEFYVTIHPENDDDFVVSNSLGEIFYLNINSKSVLWNNKIDDVFVSKAAFNIEKSSVLAYSSFGTVNEFNIVNGELVWQKVLGNIMQRSKPFFIPIGNAPIILKQFLLVYLFDRVDYIDLSKRVSMFEITFPGLMRESENVIDNVSLEQLISQPYLIGPGQELSALVTNKGLYMRNNLLTTNQINLWSHSLSVASNIVFVGEYLFCVTSDEKVIAFHYGTGKVKWISDIKISDIEQMSRDSLLEDDEKNTSDDDGFLGFLPNSDSKKGSVSIERFTILPSSEGELIILDSKDRKMTALALKNGKFIRKGGDRVPFDFDDYSDFVSVNKYIFVRNGDSLKIFK